MNATFTDSHLHFDTFDQEGLVPDLLQRASANRVARLVAIGGHREANERAARLAALHPGRIRAVAGYDRDQAGLQPDLESLRRCLALPGVGGVGEAGLDYHYHPESAEEQRRLFRTMLDLSVEFRLPVVVHSREADADTLEAPPRGVA